MISEANELLEKDNLSIIEKKLVYVYIWACLENPSISNLTNISFIGNKFQIDYNIESGRIGMGGFSINIELYKENEIIISGQSHHGDSKRYREITDFQTESNEEHVKDVILYLIRIFIRDYDMLRHNWACYDDLK